MYALIVDFYLFNSIVFTINYITVLDRFQRNCHIYAIKTAIEKGNKFKESS